MDLQEATVDQLIDELKTRPIRFVLAGFETVPFGESWVQWSHDQDPLDAIKFMCLASDYLCYKTDEWDQDEWDQGEF